MENILECRGLTKRFGQFPALYQVNCTFPKGKIVGLLGPNGSGKSTLIKMAAGLLTPSEGSMLINGREPGLATKSEVSYLPERTYLPSWKKVDDLLDFFTDFYPDFDRVRAIDMLKRLQIASGSRLKTLSKGTKEKVQLIMVMSRKAKLYLLDEPIGGVDPAARDYILDTIITNYSEDATVVISTHLISDVEKVLDDFFFISNGQVFMNGSVDEVREREGKSLDQLFREVFKC